jgi:hypothetical protein
MSDSAIVNGVKRTHYHHAEAKALHGDFLLPLKHVIEPQAVAALESAGGYLSQHALPFRSEGVVSYRAAHTQVAGNKDKKDGHGWSTVSTSVVEGLNILEVVTADRVVAQIFAEYPLEGYVPKISFLGTRFENLRIAGVPVDVKLNIDLFGDKPVGDGHYTKDTGFIGRVGRQAEKLLSFGKLEDPTLERYKLYNQGAVSGKDKDGNYTETIECSLVDQIEGTFPGSTYGHALFVPHFGTIHFATVKLLQHDFVGGVPHKTTVELTMIDATLGCIGHGSVSAARSVTNGNTDP